MTRPVIVTTTTQSVSCLRMIDSLKKGTVVPDAIYVALPPDTVPELHGKLEAAGAIVILSENYGTLTNLIPFLELDIDPEAFVVVVNDQVIYHPQFIEGLVTGYQDTAPKFEEYDIDAFVGYQGYDDPEKTFPHFRYVYQRGHGLFADIIDTVYGLGFVRKRMVGLPHIDPMTLQSEKYVYLSDSYLYSKFLYLNSTLGRVIRWPYINETNVIRRPPEPCKDKLLNGYISGKRLKIKTVPIVI